MFHVCFWCAGTCLVWLCRISEKIYGMSASTFRRCRRRDWVSTRKEGLGLDARPTCDLLGKEYPATSVALVMEDVVFDDLCSQSVVSILTLEATV